jgi:hypothetical protein
MTNTTAAKTTLKARKTKPARATDIKVSPARASKMSVPQQTLDTVPSEDTGVCPSQVITPAATPKPTKLELLIALLRREEGAALPELIAATGWQAHSVRGALAGTLKHKGFAISSTKVDGIRSYRIMTLA